MKHSGISFEGNPRLTTLGERIKAVRKAWGWSQEEMAKTLHVDQASISFWERDKIKPSGSAMVALSALFRTSVNSLELGVGFVVPTPSSPVSITKTERECPRSVSLLSHGSDPINALDLVDGSSRGKQLSEAMMLLADAVNAGRRVWIVIDDKSNHLEGPSKFQKRAAIIPVAPLNILIDIEPSLVSKTSESLPTESIIDVQQQTPENQDQHKGKYITIDKTIKHICWYYFIIGFFTGWITLAITPFISIPPKQAIACAAGSSLLSCICVLIILNIDVASVQGFWIWVLLLILWNVFWVVINFIKYRKGLAVSSF